MCLYACPAPSLCFQFFFFNDTATTEIYTLSLHDALPIWRHAVVGNWLRDAGHIAQGTCRGRSARRSEEHTSELQSQSNLVCRLLLEKKKPSFRSTTIALRLRFSIARTWASTRTFAWWPGA